MSENSNRRVKANLLLLGRSGNGKSDFINCIIGKHVAKTGFGEPVTKGFDKYEHVLKNGLPLTIYDSEGIEVDQWKTISSNVFSIIKEKTEGLFPSDWFHAIFYFINIGRSRLEDSEIDLINRIYKITNQKINIIISHCYEKNTPKANEMETELQRIEGVSKTFQCNLRDHSPKKGGFFPAYGLKEIEEAIPEILWENTARKVSERIAKEYCIDLSRKIAIQKAEEKTRNSKLSKKELYALSDQDYLKQLYKNEALSIIISVTTKSNPLIELILKDFQQLFSSICEVFQIASYDVILAGLYFGKYDQKKLAKQIITSVSKSMQKSLENTNLIQDIIHRLTKILSKETYYRNKRNALAEYFFNELEKQIKKQGMIAEHIYHELNFSHPLQGSTRRKIKSETENNNSDSCSAPGPVSIDHNIDIKY